jgi:hypothetical protein
MTESPNQDLREWAQIKLEKGRVCNKCSRTLPEGYLAVCGIKNPCPHCGYLYPVGDCAD